MTESRPTILLTRTLPDAFEQGLSQLGSVCQLDRASADQLESATVCVSTAVDPIDESTFDKFGSNLGLIANIGVGTDNIDLTEAAKREVQVANTPVVTEDTADLTWALLLAASRRLTFCESSLRQGQWATGASTLGTRVHGKTLGIVGLGAIGNAVARRAIGFGMRILYTGPTRKPAQEAELGATYVPNISELLTSADFVSLHCPLTDSNRHLLNKEQFSLCKKGQVLVNTGRGPLINEQDLAQALKSGQLAAAGLDVFEFEPEVSEELLTLDNVTALPHIGSATGECRADMAHCTFRNIKSFLETGRAEYLVSKF